MDIKSIGELIVVVSGATALLGGIYKVISLFRPPKIVVTAPGDIGIVVSVSGTTPSIHMPLVISNRAKKEGIVTHLSLEIGSVKDGCQYNFGWGLIWAQDNRGNRVPEKGANPIPVPGHSSVEKNIGFDSKDTIKWEPKLYEVKLYIGINDKPKAKEALKFFIHPIEDKCKAWYSGPYADRPWVDNIPIFRERKNVPADSPFH
jgi:hypothetical protein